MEIFATDEFDAWYASLSDFEQGRVRFLVDVLDIKGVALGFPYSSEIKGASFALRELRNKTQPIRIFYAFDPERNAVLLIGGDKTGEEKFYERMVPQCERIWDEYLAEQAAGLHKSISGGSDETS